MSAVAHSPSSTGAAAPSRNIRAMPSPNTRKAGPGIRSGAYSRRHKQMENPMTTEPDLQEPEVSMPNWGDDAPRGGMAVMNRILKDKATVPLFFAQSRCGWGPR